MAKSAGPDVIVYVCTNCLSGGSRMPPQWDLDGAHVVVREVPCSGKTDAQYLIRALEGGVHGICVAACPAGECRLAQGNYRARVRVETVRRLLAEIGLEDERVQFVCASPGGGPASLDRLVRDSVGRICALGESPIRTRSRHMTGPK